MSAIEQARAARERGKPPRTTAEHRECEGQTSLMDLATATSTEPDTTVLTSPEARPKESL